MAARQYTSITDSKTLQGSGITSAGQTTITLNNITNLPAIASGSGKTFTLVLAPDTSTEEIITVTGYGSGSVVTVTRGQEGTTAQSTHAVGTIVKHMITARDLQEPQDHIAASASVHGITGDVVGTGGSQTLTGKTLTNPIITANSKTISAIELSQLDNVNQNIQDYMTSTGTWTTITSGLSVSGGISAIGNGSLTGRICYIANTAHIEITLTVGSTTTLVGLTNITITLPSSAQSTQTPNWLIGNLYTSSGFKYNALNCRLTGTSLLPFGLNLGSSTLGELTPLTTSSVQTITTGSIITINGTYEVA